MYFLARRHFPAQCNVCCCQCISKHDHSGLDQAAHLRGVKGCFSQCGEVLACFTRHDYSGLGQAGARCPVVLPSSFQQGGRWGALVLTFRERILVLTCVFLCLPACSCAYLHVSVLTFWDRVLVLTFVFLCLPACSYAYLRVLVLTFRERVLVLTFRERVLMLTCVFLCLPACSCACLRVLVLTCVFLCLPSGSVFLCLPSGSVFLCLPACSCVYLRVLVLTCVFLCLPFGSVFLCLLACSCAYLPGAHNLVKEYYGIRYQGGSLSFIHCLTCVIFLFTLRYFPKFLNYNFPKLLCVIFLFTQCCVHTQHCELTKVAQNATATLRYATLQGSVACRKYATMPQAIHYPLLQQPHVHMSQDRSFALQSLTKYGMLHITKCIIYTELHSF